MKSFSLKAVFLALTLIAALMPFAVRALRVRQGSFGKSAAVRAMTPKLADPHFRIAVVHDLPTGKARVIAIEKHGADTTYRGLEPSFCRVDIDPSCDTALMYVQGRPVFPEAKLIVFMATYGEQPVRVEVNRDAYEEISEGGAMPAYSDLELWNLCHDSLTRS